MQEASRASRSCWQYSDQRKYIRLYCSRCVRSLYKVCSFQWPLLSHFHNRFYEHRTDTSQGIEWCEDIQQINPSTWLFFRGPTLKHKQNYPFYRRIVAFLLSITKCGC